MVPNRLESSDDLLPAYMAANSLQGQAESPEFLRALSSPVAGYVLLLATVTDPPLAASLLCKTKLSEYVGGLHQNPPEATLQSDVSNLFVLLATLSPYHLVAILRSFTDQHFNFIAIGNYFAQLQLSVLDSALLIFSQSGLSLEILSSFLVSMVRNEEAMEKPDAAYLAVLVGVRERIMKESAPPHGDSEDVGLEDRLARRLNELCADDLKLLTLSTTKRLFASAFDHTTSFSGTNYKEAHVNLAKYCGEYLLWAASSLDTLSLADFLEFAKWHQSAGGTVQQDTLFDAIHKFLQRNELKGSEQEQLCSLLSCERLAKAKLQLLSSVKGMESLIPKCLVQLTIHLSSLEKAYRELEDQQESSQRRVSGLERDHDRKSTELEALRARCLLGAQDEGNCDWGGGSAKTMLAYDEMRDYLWVAGVGSASLRAFYNNKAVMATVWLPTGTICSLATHCEGIAVGTQEGQVFMWDKDNVIMQEVALNDYSIGALIGRGNQQGFIAGGHSKVFVHNGKILERTIAVTGGPMSALAVLDDSVLWIGTDMGRIFCGDTRGGVFEKCEQAHKLNSKIWVLAPGPEGTIWSSGADGSIYKWKAGNLKNEGRITTTSFAVTSLVSCGGEVMLAGEYGAVRGWHKGKCVKTYDVLQPGQTFVSVAVGKSKIWVACYYNITQFGCPLLDD
eukprot:TRINITY_DN22919_c0_g1_i1.p1 TRINITY_DN22919_c0_g1~~TRINITY_DN22919_c0_g1_i1.p1  ORF type:complete len:677 (+),score=73.32 TRINITY_DN22919_c0_g1_i1:58-2088(+)